MQAKTVRTKKKDGRGRPPRASEAANLRLEIRLSGDELKTLAAAAATEGLPVSTWVRDLALSTARRADLSTPPPAKIPTNVIVQGRQGAAPLLTSKSKTDNAKMGAEIAAMLLARVVPRTERAVLLEVLRPRLPWTRFLPESALEEFAREFAETLEACVSIGNMNRVAEIIVDWKEKAEAYADPALAADLRHPLRKR